MALTKNFRSLLHTTGISAYSSGHWPHYTHGSVTHTNGWYCGCYSHFKIVQCFTFIYDEWHEAIKLRLLCVYFCAPIFTSDGYKKQVLIRTADRQFPKNASQLITWKPMKG
jgi:hypothetical protein